MVNLDPGLDVRISDRATERQTWRQTDGNRVGGRGVAEVDSVFSEKDGRGRGRLGQEC